MKIQDLIEGYGRYYCSTDKKWKTRKGPKQTRKVGEAYDHNAPFNAADFNRHMDALRAREELRKTDPMKALVGDMIDKDREKEALAKRKKPEDDSMSTSDPRHPQYAYTQAGQQGVAEGSLNEFAPNGFNGDDGEEFNPRMAKMAYDEGVVKGVSLADGATLEMALKINHWDSHDGGIYKQHFAKGFKVGRMDKIRFDNKQYNLNLKLMKDGSIRHGEQDVTEGSNDTIYPNAEVIKSRNGKPVGEIYQDENGWGCFHYKADNGADSIGSREEALEWLKDIAEEYRQDRNLREQGLEEEKTRLDAKCWTGKHKEGTKIKGDTRVNNCVPNESLEETYDGDEFFEAYGELWFNEDEQLDEAEYQGRSVPLGKPMQGDVKKFKVYVKDPSTGNVKKVNFGDPDMKIRKSNPAARRSFRARHNCDNPGPRTKARFWSCRKW